MAEIGKQEKKLRKAGKKLNFLRKAPITPPLNNTSKSRTEPKWSSVLAKYAKLLLMFRGLGHFVRQASIYPDNVWLWAQENIIFAGHEVRKLSGRGSKGPPEHWRPAGHFVRQTRNDFCVDWVITNYGVHSVNWAVVICGNWESAHSEKVYPC